MTDRYPMALTPPGSRKQIVVANAEAHRAKAEEWGIPFVEGVVPETGTVHVHVIESSEEATAALRKQYQAKAGKRPFMGWDADQLRAKIEAL